MSRSHTGWMFAKRMWPFSIVLGLALLLVTVGVGAAQDNPRLIFAVVIQISKDSKRVTAQVSAGGKVHETTLLAPESILRNPIWRSLEVCHALRAQAMKETDGYRLVSVRMLDAAMLPMSLQGIAGDCFFKKALDYAPLVD